MIKMDEYKISIIVPCYQVEQYIFESVLSMKNQLFDNYEIILVDDGTKDNSISVAQEALEGFESVRVLRQQNRGLPAARNAGIKAAQGKYVCFLDSDDIITPTHLQDLYELCESNRLNVGFSLFEGTKDNNRHGTFVAETISYVIEREQLLKEAMDRTLKIHCCSLLINRDFLLNNNLFFNEALRYAEDTEYRWRLFPKLDRIGCTNRATYKYLMRTNSLMTSQNVDMVLLAIDTINDTIANNSKEYPSDQRIWDLLPQRVYLAFCRSFARSSSYKTFLELVDKSQQNISLSFIIKYKDLRVKILAMTYCLNKKIFFHLAKQ